MYPTYPTIYDVEPEPAAPPAAPEKKRARSVIALVLAGAVVGGGVGGVVGAHYGSDSTISPIGSGTTPISAPVADPKSYTAIAAKVLPSVVSLHGPAGGGGGAPPRGLPV